MRNHLHAFLAFVLIPIFGHAEPATPPRVATDIVPVHALVSAVMQGIGTPELIMSPGASPHSYAMRPSQAFALNNAELVFWVGEALTPWLSAPMSTLAEGATVVALAGAPDTRILRLQDGSGIDPHLWLDPRNASVWLDEIARRLATHDPSNAESYNKNAQAMQSLIQQVTAEITASLLPLKGLKYVTYHDSFKYFEQAFSIPSIAAILPSDAAPRSAAQFFEFQRLLKENNVTCLLSEPGASSATIANSLEPGIHITQVDPLGNALFGSPNMYPKLLTNIAAALHSCPR